MSQGNLLSLVIFLPVAGAILAAFLPRGEANQHRALALVVSIVTFCASLGLWLGFDGGVAAPEFQFEVKASWIPSLGIGYHVGLDGVALLLLMLTTALTPIVILSAWNAVHERVKEFMISLLVLETAMIGTFSALDLILFYVFWESLLIPMYLLIDGLLVNGSARLAAFLGRSFRGIQSGDAQRYAAIMAIAAAVILWTVLGVGGR